MKDDELELIKKRSEELRNIVAVVLMFDFILKNDRFADFLIHIIESIKNRKTEQSKITSPSRYKLLKLSEILFSAKTQKEVFLVTMADWDEEIFQALKEDKDAKLLMINVRNTYAFLLVMWMKSPIGDLIEFVRKIAK